MDESRGKVLIIDDDAIVRRFAAIALEALAPVSVLEAASGEEGIARALADRPDVIVLDMHMPDMSGQEALDKLRSTPWTACIPVMFFSSRAQPRSGRLGVEGVLRKSLGPVSLTQAVLEVLGRTRTHRLLRPD